MVGQAVPNWQRHNNIRPIYRVLSRWVVVLTSRACLILIYQIHTTRSPQWGFINHLMVSKIQYCSWAARCLPCQSQNLCQRGRRRCCRIRTWEHKCEGLERSWCNTMPTPNMAKVTQARGTFMRACSTEIQTTNTSVAQAWKSRPAASESTQKWNSTRTSAMLATSPSLLPLQEVHWSRTWLSWRIRPPILLNLASHLKTRLVTEPLVPMNGHKSRSWPPCLAPTYGMAPWVPMTSLRPCKSTRPSLFKLPVN